MTDSLHHNAVSDRSYIDLNAELNFYDTDGSLRLDYDVQACRQYFLQYVNPNTVFFHDLEEKMDYLIDNDYYDRQVVESLPWSQVKELFHRAYDAKYRFASFIGAMKFYTSYALKTRDGSRFLERYEDRVVMTALMLAGGDADRARTLVDEMISGRMQPATPTFLNAGRSQRGEHVSCFPAGTRITLADGTTTMIENVVVGDHVITHTGESRRVYSTMVNDNERIMVTIKPAGGSAVTMTEDHPVLVWSDDPADAPNTLTAEGLPGPGYRWVEAKDIRVRQDYVLLPAQHGSVENSRVIVDEKYTADPVETVYNLEVEQDHSYLAEGVAVHNCFLIRTEDQMESITSVVSAALQLSKRGGGVGICLTNLRERGAAIKGIMGAASGVVPVMKILEDCFSYANQLGARQGAGAVYISVCHPDVLAVMDTKRENADEKIRIKTLSLGLIIPDVAFELARANKDLYQFSPADVEKVYGVPMSDISITEHYHDMVEDSRIRKSKISARALFQTIAELQFESGYPYLMFEDTVNTHNHVAGRVSMSNLCSEILQVSTPAQFAPDGSQAVEGRDISCNLSSINIAHAMSGPDFGSTVDTAIRALTRVSDVTSIESVPSVRNGNEKSHSVGLGAMNLHGFLGSEKIIYGSEEALDFVNVFFATMRYHALSASCAMAAERGETFFEFDQSAYYNPDGYCEALTPYTSGVWETHPHTERIREMFSQYGQWYPEVKDWRELDEKIREHGLYNAYLMAVAPTGSISYINHATSSVHPIVSKIEIRKEGRIGRVYAPSPGMTNETLEYFDDAYTIGYQRLIDTYAVAQKHVDQGMSLTMFFRDTATTRDLNKAYIYAWSRGRETNEYGEPALWDPRTSWRSGFIKTLYYSRIRQTALAGTEVTAGGLECVSCTI